MIENRNKTDQRSLFFKGSWDILMDQVHIDMNETEQSILIKIFQILQKKPIYKKLQKEIQQK
jgi:hypothetical protein